MLYTSPLASINQFGVEHNDRRLRPAGTVLNFGYAYAGIYGLILGDRVVKPTAAWPNG